MKENEYDEGRASAHERSEKRFVIVCEHLFALPELPCGKVLYDPAPGCTLDSGITYLCLRCVEDAYAGKMELLGERLKTMCEEHYSSDAMTVMHTHDARTR